MKFIPSVNLQCISLTEKRDSRFYEELNASPNWWESKSFFRYPALLVSAHYVSKGIKNDTFRKNNNIPDDDFLVMGDSGGYQALSLGISNHNIDKKSLLWWQEKNCNIGMSLDEPLAKGDISLDIQRKFKHDMNNVKEAIEYRRKELYPKMKFYGATHGWNEKSLKKYHNELPKDKLDGYGIGECTIGLNDSEENILSRIALECQLNDDKKPMHILGTSSPIIITFLSMLEEKEGIEFTYDSTSYMRGSRHHSYVIDCLDSKSMTINKNTTEKQLPCGCPVCSKVSIDDMKGSDGQSALLIDLHNLWKEIQFYDSLYDYDLDVLKKRYPKKKSIKKIEQYQKLGLDKFVKMFPYTNKFQASSVDLSKFLGKDFVDTSYKIKDSDYET